MLASIGRWSFRHPWYALAIWIVALVGVGGAAGAIGSAFSATFEIPDSETADGFETLDEYFGGAGSGIPGSIVFSAEQGVTDPEVQTAMSEMFAEVAVIDKVSLTSPYDPQAQQIAPDGSIAYASLTLDADVDQTESMEIGEEITSLIPDDIDGLQVEVGGQALAEFEPPESELIGLSFAVVILIVSFGSVLAMGLPIGTAVFGVGIGVGLITLLTNVMEMPDFSIQLGAMIGLGVGIDYALFIVNRHREGLHALMDPLEAASRALDTAGRAVIFAGITVVISLLGMTLMGLSFITGLGVGASITVLITMLASITLLPAFLGFAGDRIETTRIGHLAAAAVLSLLLLSVGLGFGGDTFRLGALIAIVVLFVAAFFVPPLNRLLPPRTPKPMRETIPYRWSRMIQSYPWLFAVGGVAVLLTLAYPLLDLRLGFSDEGNFPEETTTRKAYDMIAEGFGPGFNGPFLAVVEIDSPADLPTVAALTEAISTTEGVAVAAGPLPNNPDDPQAAIINIVPTTSPQDEATETLVKELRDEVIPGVIGDSDTIEVNVTGGVPANIDFTRYLSQRIVIFFGAVLGLSFLLLMMVFRSVLVPLKAVIMNVISIGAAYGVVVAIFQWGWLGDIIGIEPAPIEPFVPMMLFAIVFGLSMDYEVFLLSRIKEEYDRTGDSANSVADGLAATARVISAAAAIMVVVFGAFLLEENRIIKMFGVGLAVAVMLDATLVRMLLVPATMELLGDRNWWLPRWLDRILPRLNVEGPAEVHAGVGAPGDGGLEVTAVDGPGPQIGPAGNGEKPDAPSEEPVGSR